MAGGCGSRSHSDLRLLYQLKHNFIQDKIDWGVKLEYYRTHTAQIMEGLA